MIRSMKRLAAVVILLSLMATTCGDSDRDTFECFDIGGEQICDNPPVSSRIDFLIDTDEPENFVLRFHPEDAELYSLREVNPLMPLRTPRVITVNIERLEPGPTTVCLRNNVYLEDVREQDRALVFKGGQCTSLGLRGPVELTWGSPSM